MMQGRFGLRSAALLCAMLLTVTGLATVAAAPARPGEDVAFAAKKKCKKAHRSAVAAKKRCKKRRTLPPPTYPVTPVYPATPPAAAPPSLSISPTSHNFGTVFGDSADQTFTVTNSGGSPSGTLASSLAGNDPGNFAIATDTCDATTLGASSICTVDVHCSNAEANNVTRTATLTVAGSPGGSPLATLTCFETT